MAINPFLMLSGIGMMAVAIAAILYWKAKAKTDWKFFLAGAGIWVAAIIVKLVLDMTVTIPLQQWVLAGSGITGALIVLSIYVGLRTGLLESGISYFAVLRTWLKKMTFKEAVAFGIGFGSLEAIIVGFTSLLNILVFVLMPEILATIPVDYQALVIEQLSASTLFVIPAIIERGAAILIHVFAAALVVYAIRSGQIKYLYYSIAYKFVVDGIIPGLVYVLQPNASLLGAYLIELPFIALAVIGFYGTIWLKKKEW